MFGWPFGLLMMMDKVRVCDSAAVGEDCMLLLILHNVIWYDEEKSQCQDYGLDVSSKNPASQLSFLSHKATMLSLILCKR